MNQFLPSGHLMTAGKQLKMKLKKKGQDMARKTKNPQQQTFSISAPTAMSVLLAGDFTHWHKEAMPMEKQESGVWKATIKLAPGTHHYRFIVDGQWRDDPDCTLRVANPYGSEDSVRQVT